MHTKPVSKTNSPTSNDTLLAVRALIGGFSLTVDLSAEGVSIPIVPRDGQITLEYSLSTPGLKFVDGGISAVHDFYGTTCRTFVPISLCAVVDVDLKLAAQDVAVNALWPQ